MIARGAQIWRRRDFSNLQTTRVIGGERFCFNPFWTNSQLASRIYLFPREDGKGHKSIPHNVQKKFTNLDGVLMHLHYTVVKFFLDDDRLRGSRLPLVSITLKSQMLGGGEPHRSNLDLASSLFCKELLKGGNGPYALAFVHERYDLNFSKASTHMAS
ncbi:hypothetical protein Tco_1401447 [Tanacetum coccineum]